MIRAHNKFNENLQRVRDIGAIYTTLEGMVRSTVDISDILRSQLVLSVSAFDAFIHDVVRIGVCEIISGQRSLPLGLDKLLVSIGTCIKLLNDEDYLIHIEEEILKRHSFQTFQHPDNVSSVLKIIYDPPIWEKVSQKAGFSDAASVKRKLSLIVERRNKIAHEADCIPSAPGSRWPIETSSINESVEFIQSIGDAIFELLNE